MTREQVSDIFLTRLPATLTITVPILLLEVALAIPIAMLVAYYRGRLLDRVIMAVCLAAVSISLLVYIIVGQDVPAFALGWFPVHGRSDDLLAHYGVEGPLPARTGTPVRLAPQTR